MGLYVPLSIINSSLLQYYWQISFPPSVFQPIKRNNFRKLNVQLPCLKYETEDSFT